jgi:AraC family transcriptional regulator of adaptative response / DNA-3-methyladenine glycosylase II
MTNPGEVKAWWEVRLPCNAQFDVGALITYFKGHTVRGIEEVAHGRYRRSIGLPDARGVIELDPALRLRLRLEHVKGEARAVERCRNLLDLDRDPTAISSVRQRDPLLASLVAARPGLRVAGAGGGFELAVRAVLGQQVSVAGACTLIGRVVGRLGKPLSTPLVAATHFSPTPQAVVEGDLSGPGITGGRIVALQALSTAVAGGQRDLRRGADTEITSTLRQALPGIGPWTVHYIAMRARVTRMPVRRPISG